MKAVSAMLAFLLFSMFVPLMFSQNITRVTEVVEVVNHGGYMLVVNDGANQGDRITLDVKCSLPSGSKECFEDWPRTETAEQNGFLCLLLCANYAYLQNILDDYQHQIYETSAYSTGDEFIIAPYAEFGWDKSFDVKITAKEKTQLP